MDNEPVNPNNQQSSKFVCSSCALEVEYDYFGSKPPYHPRIM